jgi:hypothetical protein
MVVFSDRYDAVADRDPRPPLRVASVAGIRHGWIVVR